VAHSERSQTKMPRRPVVPDVAATHHLCRQGIPGSASVAKRALRWSSTSASRSPGAVTVWSKLFIRSVFVTAGSISRGASYRPA